MSQSRRLTNALLLDAAVEAVEENGLNELSMQDLASRLGVKPPSLYNHISGLNDVRRQLTKEVLHRMEDAIRDSAVGRSGENALREMALAYRRSAKTHPELYRAFASSRQPRDPEIEAGVQSLLAVLSRVLEGYGLDPEKEVNFIRIFHSGIHGFVSLETAGFFGGDLPADESFDELIRNQAMLLNYYKTNSEE